LSQTIQESENFTTSATVHIFFTLICS